MFKTLTTKIADRIIDQLEEPTRKAVNRYRRNPSPENERSALTVINRLKGDEMTSLKQAARV